MEVVFPFAASVYTMIDLLVEFCFRVESSALGDRQCRLVW